MLHKMEKVEGGITAAGGVEAAGVHCGLKKEGEKDLALFRLLQPAAAAGVFTTNRFKAPPVTLAEKHLTNFIKGLVVNSGNANACTGEQGFKDAFSTVQKAAQKLDCHPEEVLVASTGVIGVYLPMDKIYNGIELAFEELSPLGGRDAAEAILTTDTVIKETSYRVLDDSTGDGETEGERPSFYIGGTAKGSGMICPDMATMLAFLVTDVKISRDLLQKALQEAVKYSFNTITVDGETSTNDAVLLMATGSSDVEIAGEGETWEAFKEALLVACRDLSYQIIADGEGVTKIIKLTVKGAPDYETARTISRSILNSALVKTAFFGEDANWGRIITAMGASGADFYPHKVDIFLGDVQVTSAGRGLVFDEDRAAQVLAQREVPLLVDLHSGPETLTTWGCDLSYEYVSINSAYRS